jgi:hypothetical protein
MKNRNLTYDVKFVHLAGAVSAGTDGSAVDLAEIDTKGYSGVIIVAYFGTSTGSTTTTITVKNYATAGAPGAGTIDDIGSIVATAPGSNYASLEIRKPQKRYLKARYQRETANQVITHITAILHNRTDAWTKSELDTVASSSLDTWAVLVEPKPSLV